MSYTGSYYYATAASPAGWPPLSLAHSGSFMPEASVGVGGGQQYPYYFGTKTPTAKFSPSFPQQPSPQLHLSHTGSFTNSGDEAVLQCYPYFGTKTPTATPNVGGGGNSYVTNSFTKRCDGGGLGATCVPMLARPMAPAGFTPHNVAAAVEDVFIPQGVVLAPPHCNARYTNVRTVDSGAFGTVYEMLRSDGRRVAVKEISEKVMQSKADIEREVQTLQRLRHDRIVHYLDYFECPRPGGTKAHTYLVMEFCGGGSLKDWIVRARKSGQKPPTAVLLTCLQQLAEGLQFMHQNSVEHRDFKSANVILEQVEGEESGVLSAKITDMGRARLFRDYTETTKCGGDFSTTPPEYHQRGEISPKFDCWSLGCVLAELLTLDILGVHRCHRVSLALDEQALGALLRQVQFEVHAKVRPECLHTLLWGLLCADPTQRLSTDDVLRELQKYLQQVGESEVNVQQQQVGEVGNKVQALVAAVAKAPQYGLTREETARLWKYFCMVNVEGAESIPLSKLKSMLALLQVDVPLEFLQSQLANTTAAGVVSFDDVARWWGRRDQTWLQPRTAMRPNPQALQVMKITPELFQQMKATFDALDSDHVGKVPAAKFYNLLVLLQCDVTAVQLLEIMHSLRLGKGDWAHAEVTWHKFLSWWMDQMDSATMTFQNRPVTTTDAASATPAALPTDNGNPPPPRVGTLYEVKRSSGKWEPAALTEVKANGEWVLTYLDGSGFKSLPVSTHQGYLRKLDSQDRATTTTTTAVASS